MKRFWETLRKQMEAHHGGSRWIGTGRQLPVRPLGQRQGRRPGRHGRERPALGAQGDRRAPLHRVLGHARACSGANLCQALASLKQLTPAGPRDELDLDATIYQSARNGGEIDLVFRRDLLDRIEVVLLIDNGGSSMLPFVRAHPAALRQGAGPLQALRHLLLPQHDLRLGLQGRPRAASRCPSADLLQRNPETRLLIVGDASMAPEELLWPRGAISWGDGRPRGRAWSGCSACATASATRSG